MRKMGMLLLILALLMASGGIMSGIVSAAVAVINTGTVGWEPSVSGSIIAFGTHESWIGQDLNGDGDDYDYVLRYYDISTDTLTNTGVVVGGPPSVSGSIVAYVYEGMICYYDISTGTITNTDVVGGPWHTSVSGSIIAFRTREGFVGQDLNGDGDVHDDVIRYYDISTDTLTNTGAAGSYASVSGSIIAFHTSEQHVGQDLNGDGDMGDDVIRYWDISTGTITNTGAAGRDPSVSGSIIAFNTPEGWIGQDVNGDGDMYDYAVRYYDISTDTLANTGAVGGWTSTSGTIITFWVSEWDPISETGQDINGDGDMWDVLIRYYDVSKGTLTETCVDGSMPSVSGSIIVFSTHEGAVGQDVNGDGDTDDPVIRYLILEEAPTIETVSDQVDAYLTDGSIDNEGIAEASHSFLDQAQAMIDRGNVKAAINILNAFIRSVEAQSGKHITADAAQSLIDSAQAVINSL